MQLLRWYDKIVNLVVDITAYSTSRHGWWFMSNEKDQDQKDMTQLENYRHTNFSTCSTVFLNKVSLYKTI